MTSLLDTNVLVRHFTGLPRGQAQRATALLESAPRLWLVDVVVAEVVYVLQSVYRVPRDEIGMLLRAVIAHPTVSVADARVLLRSLELFVKERLDYAEAYLAALAESTGAAVASFDRSLDRIETVTLVEP